jgi:hypothetical protein
VERDRRLKSLLHQSFMGRRVVRLDKGLMHLFKFCWRLRQGELIVKQASLDVKVGLVRSVG